MQLDPTAPGVAIVGLSELQELNQEQKGEGQQVAVQLDPTAPGVAIVGLSELQELNQEQKAGGSPSMNKVLLSLSLGDCNWFYTREFPDAIRCCSSTIIINASKLIC